MDSEYRNIHENETFHEHANEDGDEEGCQCNNHDHKHEKEVCEYNDKDYEEKNCECKDIEEYDCGCNDSHHEKDNRECHDNDHDGCACEHGILEDIDSTDTEKSKKPIYILGTGIIIFIIGYFISILNFSLTNYITQDLISQLIFLSVVVIVGQGIIRHGIKSLLNKEVKIEFLITVATIGAFILGDGAEGASLILLFFLAEYLEHYSLDKSKKSLTNLVNLSPDVATVKKIKNKGTEKEKIREIQLNVKDIAIGDLIIVKPGDKIPIDGVIEKGSTSVNQASITGESLAASKSIGDEVYASTINEEGYIEIKVTKLSDDTIFSRIIDLIKESEEKKAKVNLLIDKFAKYYTPMIIVLAILVATIPWLLFNQPLDQWIYKALVLLVIACPCALVISTPVSMVSAITAGTKNGIIIKGGEYIEALSKIKAIMFDKTGTLTEGNLEIENIKSTNEFNDEEVLKIACSLENKSKHPIAKTFNDYQRKNNIELKEVNNFQSLSGRGLKGEINNETYYVGKKELFKELPEYTNNSKLQKDILSLNNEDEEIKIGKTSVIIGSNDKILGIISLTDKIRDNGPETIEQLKNKSIETIMLTGDNSATAKTVAEKLGLNNYYPNLLPEDKVNIVEEVATEYNDVAMVGDGVNDTPSLARANVGIAMGMGGADVAVETADIVLMQDNISKVDYLINLAKKTMNVVKQNITVSLSVKAVLAILGVIGYVSLWQAVLIGDMGLTLLVVANALRISNS